MIGEGYDAKTREKFNLFDMLNNKYQKQKRKYCFLADILS